MTTSLALLKITVVILLARDSGKHHEAENPRTITPRNTFDISRFFRTLRRSAMTRFLLTGLAAALALGRAVSADELRYKTDLLVRLARQTPNILKTYDPQSGRFGTGIWICGDQHAMYPLAVVYATPDPKSRYYRSPELLKVITKAGDLLIEKADPQGRWVFEKKDGSTWGMVWMPWTYSRWIRTFGLICDAMPAEARQRWTDALVRGYTGISRNELRSVHNIPAHHAMGLYAAGKVLDRPEWCQQAAQFLRRVAAAQSEGGYWAEGGGPVVRYNFVYIDALGTYYAMSGDKAVLPALEKAARFHRQFTYPTGQAVETIDGRNPLEMLFPSADSNRPLPEAVAQGNVGFTFSPVGRAYLKHQWARAGMDRLDPDLMASLVLYGEEGPVEEPPPAEGRESSVLVEGGIPRAATIRQGPWFLCLSAYTAPVVASRWIQDRQNLASVYHDATGVIFGGGNTKLQPAWSTFTAGDMGLLAHRSGDENPVFTPKGPLYHVPSQASLVTEPEPGLDLTYGPVRCRLRLRILGPNTLEYRLEAGEGGALPVAAHLTVVPRMGRKLTTGSGHVVTIGAKPVALDPQQVRGQVTYAGFRLHLPPAASLYWPALPHNPYRKDGRAEPAEGRIEIRLPFDAQHAAHLVTVEILPETKAQ